MKLTVGRVGTYVNEGERKRGRGTRGQTGQWTRDRERLEGFSGGEHCFLGLGVDLYAHARIIVE